MTFDPATAASAIYRGTIRHRRHAPHPHAFSYAMYMLYLDLDEVGHAFDGRWLWSTNARNVAQFRRSDYLGPARVPLADAVRARVREASGRAPEGPIRLLTHLRYFGLAFNPVSFYYCYAADGTTLDTIVAEITNTPWRERHSYVLPVADAVRTDKVGEWRFEKQFHVSPFMAMEREYRWRFQPPGASIRVHMDVLNGEDREFDATLVLDRRPLTGANLARCLARWPLMTGKVLAAIHWQAFLIWLRRNPVYDHPGLGPSGRKGQ
ncbi:MAG TPA: DUF1365 domain-containing protein [Xanthomonadales bacterium]|nr:DUF1365 domain-containing protein [Xanthomonadales bacterium]